MSCLCPLCQGASFEEIYSQVPDFEHGLPRKTDLSVCRRCGLVVQNPQPTLDALLSFYPTDYRPHVSGTASGGGGVLGWLKSIQSRLLVERYHRWLPANRDARILDLGCGSGQFLRALGAAGYRNLTGMDRSPSLAESFEGTSVRFFTREIEPDLRLEEQFDVIVMNYVIEHFLEPLQVLRRCKLALADGGRILILTPNIDSLAHRTFGRYWSGLHAPRHTHLFSPSTMNLVARTLGFQKAEIGFITDPASWAFSFQNWVRSRAVAPSFQRGTAWYGLAALPFVFPIALVERWIGRSASIVVSLSP